MGNVLDEGISIVQQILRDRPQPPAGVDEIPSRELFVAGLLDTLKLSPDDAEDVAFAQAAFTILTDNTPEATPAKIELLKMLEEYMLALKADATP